MSETQSIIDDTTRANVVAQWSESFAVSLTCIWLPTKEI